MEKQTKILIGVGAAIALYLILKPKTAASSTSKIASDPTIIGGGIVPNTGGIALPPDTGGVGVLGNPEGDSHPPALPVVEATKDCVVTYFSCGSGSRSETIQIPLGDSCEKHQPAMPQCAPPGGGGMFMVAPMVPTMELNFV